MRPALARAGLALALALAAPLIAYGEDATNYDEPGITYGREYLAQHFAERIDPFSGNLSLQFVDLSIPGNAGFDLRVVRSYNANAAGVAQSPFGRGWDMHFGRVVHRADQTCTGATPQTMHLEMPDGGRQTLHRSNGVAGTSSTDYLTTTFWKGQCATAGGIDIYSPDGTKYEMTEFDGAYWHAKKVVDRFGNYLTLTYEVNAQMGRKVVKSVVANDGRSVNFTYASGKLAAVTGGGVTWNYVVTTATDGSGSYQLTRVSPPAGGYWSYLYNGNLGTLPGSYLLRQVTNPFGGDVSYEYDRVSFLSVLGAPPTTVVKAKTAGSDRWTYQFEPSCSRAGMDKTTVTLPAGLGTVAYEHFGYCTVTAGTVWKIGLLDKKTTGTVQTETFAWSSQAISGESLVRPGYSKIDNQILRPLLGQRVVARDSVNYTTTLSSFDSYGNPQTIAESGTQSRTRTLSYFNSTALWVIGLVNDETTAGVAGAIDRTRGSVGELRSESRYGVTTSFTYFADGSLWTRTDANSRTTTFSNYLHGTARNEQRPESVTITRTVDQRGNVTSQSDGEQVWHYGYDGLGRLTSIDFPTGADATITWGTTTRTMTRGTLTEQTTFDSFGRDSSISREGIVRSFEHDALGRVTFESLPGSSQGTTTTYDLLDRPKVVSFPVGSRTHAYTSGGMSVTDERGYVTRFEYDRYGDPDGGYLTTIAAPIGAASVGITRNKIGVVLSIVQDGITRTLGRDSRYFHTSTTEPETGTITFGRDGVGNMTSRTGGGQTVNYAFSSIRGFPGFACPSYWASYCAFRNV